MEWATQKVEDPIELRVYPGADGDFVLYEDENDGYAYEKGAHATIAMHWNDGAKTLTIGEREGSFPGMLRERTFNVVVVGKGTTQAVKYVGEKVAVK
jgi:alpha-D-xyloside xylohydrolase